MAWEMRAAVSSLIDLRNGAPESQSLYAGGSSQAGALHGSPCADALLVPVGSPGCLVPPSLAGERKANMVNCAR